MKTIKQMEAQVRSALCKTRRERTRAQKWRFISMLLVLYCVMLSFSRYYGVGC